jgi:hypothetical protein
MEKDFYTEELEDITFTKEKYLSFTAYLEKKANGDIVNSNG